MEDIESVKTYIDSQNDWIFKAKLQEVVKLSGGLANYVYRLIFQDKTTAVLKYFSNFLAFDRTVQMSQNRYFVEKEVLKILGNHEELQNSRLRVPKLLYFDDSKYIIIMEDAGQQTKTLLDCLKADQPPLSNEIIDLLAKEIFQFLQFLRNKSGISLSTHKDPLENISVWNIFRSYSIPLYNSEAKRFNLENELKIHLDKANELLQQPSNDEGSFVYGDLWPSNFSLFYKNLSSLKLIYMFGSFLFYTMLIILPLF